MSLHAEMGNSMFHATLTLDQPEFQGALAPMDAKNTLETFVRAKLDTIGLLNGAAIDCEVVQLELPNGDVVVLSTHFDGLQVEKPDQFAYLSIIAEHVPGIRLGMADFRQAIRAPADTALFCYRGLDGIRADIALREGIGTETASWQRMREITGLDRQRDIDHMKTLADARRHGNEVDISGDERAEALSVLQRAILAYSDWCASEVPAVRRDVERSRDAH